MPRNIVIVGGHGQVALRLARLLSPTNTVTSLIRNPSQSSAIEATGAKPHVISLDGASVADFTKVFEDKKADLVYFSASAPGIANEEALKAIDYGGAVKVFDAIEASARKPRLILVSSLEVRNPDKIPPHYNEEDLATSRHFQDLLNVYLKYKTLGDINLMKRTAFKWTIIRPGLLHNEPGTGKCDVGRTRIKPPISRDDVANILALLADREDAAGLALDLVGGETPVGEALDIAIKEKKTWRIDEIE